MKWLAGAFVLLALAIGAATAVQPSAPAWVAHWLRYRLTGYLPPPLVAGRHGRVFLGNHEDGPRLSLIRDVCGDGVAPSAVADAAALIRPLLAAGEATGLPFRFVIAPSPPRIYPEDVPRGIPCHDWPADALVRTLASGAVVYPVGLELDLKRQFDVLPRRHFHWAGEGPLRVAENVADGMGLLRGIDLTFKNDNRSSDLNGFYPGLGLHDRVRTPDIRAAGAGLCFGPGCRPPLPQTIALYMRPGGGRLLVIADSFGDEIGPDFLEYAGTVWLVRMNLALAEPHAIETLLPGFHPDAVVVVYHDAGAMAFDAPARSSLALAAQYLRDLRLPAPAASP